MNRASKLTPETQQNFILTLCNRFLENTNRHMGIEWDEVEKKLVSKPDKLWAIYEMECTGGEPDVVIMDNESGVFHFVDCSAETPMGRRSVCYDLDSQNQRKEHKPENNAMDMATQMGVELLTEDEYRQLQKYGAFDTKTSSWIKTPEAIRQLGGALFCDRRYNEVFTYHNGASSYYAVRGFRASVTL